jgi:hypothetical protein
MVAILDMPESPAELARWLDRILMSEDLAVIVDELTVVHQTDDEAISVEEARDWLGDSFPAVMDRGLGALSQSRLRQLLVRPCLLPAMQELALVSGGPYWNQVMRDVPTKVAASVVERELPRNRSNSRWLFAFVPLAVAVSVAAFVAIDAGRDKGSIKPLPHSDLTVTRGTGGDTVGESGGHDNPWGWNRTDVLDGINSPGEIPTRLADALNEWFSLGKAAGTDIQSFTLRVNEMWAGCEQFSTQPFNGMPADLNQRLRGSIAAFQQKLEAVLNTLDGPLPEGERASTLAAARSSVDSCVSEAVETLRKLK